MKLVAPPSYRLPVAEAWNPWRALRAREHVRLRWALLPRGTRGLLKLDGDRATISLDARLDQRQRNATLAHETRP